MSQYQNGGWCYTCNYQRLFVRQKPNHILHLILSILTVGI